MKQHCAERWKPPASSSSTRTAAAPEYACANARGRGPPSDRWRAEQSVPLSEWRMPGHKFTMLLVTQGIGLTHKVGAAGVGLCGGSHWGVFHPGERSVGILID